jgi:phenylalanyl-tRNA synthetase alpha chain
MNTAPEANKGHLHPITHVIREIRAILGEIGFTVAIGPELETEFYNFDALNIPSDHPSRDMQDTFWIKQKKGNSNIINKDRLVLRTQTSAVQIHHMEKNQPPFRIIVPGKVFRNEATDATHEMQFFQIEGLYIDKEVNFAQLKWTLEFFLKKLFGEDAKIRFRPSYFPFVEPAVEVDVWFKGKWLEVLGAGLVHPNVLEAGGINKKEWTGFAFGGGIDRFAMIKYNIDDIRSLYNGDLRVITQF